MKIFNNSIDKMLQIYKKHNFKKENKESVRLERKDEFKLSSEARDFQVAMKELKNIPDIRKDKVEEIKNKLNTGTYSLDAGKIVEKMLDSANIDRRI